MDFKLKDEQLMIQKTARDFAKKELEPVAQKLDKTKDFSILVDNIKKMAE
ncbi:MAG: acyl-CoA dehydrogenase family protein, partial [Thermodesulfobacteriota bacterium]